MVLEVAQLPQWTKALGRACEARQLEVAWGGRGLWVHGTPGFAGVILLP